MVDGKVGYLKNSLIHMADTGFSRYLVRWNRYTDLMAQEIKEQFREKEKRQNNAIVVFCQGLDFLLVKPVWWFLLAYIRHKGFLDSWQGFVFSLFSSLRFPTGYLKFLNMRR
ncbi:hypothetical protein HZB97_01345 [Candidatus Gottesmanbacteria bacterium]|nr:hypothetical protein [Candidatus Gottesmanbacteria bacterium]